MSSPVIPGFRLGIYVFKDVEVVDFASPYGVFSVACRFDPELDVFLVAESTHPVQAQAGKRLPTWARRRSKGLRPLRRIAASVARVMEYADAHRLYREDIEYATAG